LCSGLKIGKPILAGAIVQAGSTDEYCTSVAMLPEFMGAFALAHKLIALLYQMSDHFVVSHGGFIWAFS
jgi:hypothetical protein